MSGTQFNAPRFTPVNNSGVPRAGAKLTFYRAGTTTLATVYTTSALTVAHASPVVADASGLFAAIYLDPSAGYDYKAVLTTSGGALLWSEDNIPASPSLSATAVGEALYPRSTAEIAAGVLPTNYRYPPGNLLRYGGDPTGGADSTDALATWALLGGPLTAPAGTYLTDSQVSFLVKGTIVRGDGAQWGTEIGTATVIKASASFSGDHVVLFNASSTSRACGMYDLTVDGGTASNAHGLTIRRGYDNAIFQNVSVQNIADGKHAWNSIPATDTTYDTTKSQTIIFANIIGRHRASTATAATFNGRYLQECLFINPKMWAGADSSATAAADCYHLKSCNGVTMVNPAAAFSSGAAFKVEADSSYSKSITIDTPTIENCAKPLVTKTTSQQLFGTVSPVPAVGATLTQGGVTGTIYLATASGIYVNNLAGGTFTTGVSCTVGGVATLTPTTIYAGRVSGLEFRSPRLTGLTAYASGQEYVIDDTVDSRIDFGEGISYVNTNNEPTAVYDLKVNQSPLDSDASNAGCRGLDIVYSSYPNAITTSGKEVRLIRKGYPLTQTGTLIGASAYTMPPAKVGQEITYLNDDLETYHQLAGDTGDQFRINGATAKYLRLAGLGSVVTLICEVDGYWEVKSFTGILWAENAGFFHAGAQKTQTDTSASVAIGTQHVGFYLTNTGASNTVTYNLAAAVVGMDFTFVRDNATYAIRIDPNGTETIRGGGAGKYLSLDSSGACVRLRCIAAGSWEILHTNGTTAFEP